MAYTQDQINQAFALRRAEGFTDEQINEMANNLGLTEQNVLDARKAWLGTEAGNDWLGEQTPLQQDWNKTFWVGDFEGAQDVLNREKLTPSVLQSQYGVSPQQMADVSDRYDVYAAGVTPPPPAPTPPPAAAQPKPDFSNLSGAQVGPGMTGGNVLRGPGQRASFTYGRPTAEFGGWANRYTKGASGNEMLGAGDADYNSQLIQSLRQSSANTPFSQNAGVVFSPSTTARTPVTFNPGTGNAFDPQPFAQTAAPNLTSDEQLTNSIGRTQVPSEGWTVGQATTALANELALRPGSTEEALRIQALRYPGVTPELFQAAYQNVKGGGGGGVGTGTETWNQY